MQLGSSSSAPPASTVGHRSSVTDLQFDTDGVLLATASTDGCVRLYDTDEMNAPATTLTTVTHTGAAEHM